MMNSVATGQSHNLFVAHRTVPDEADMRQPLTGTVVAALLIELLPLLPPTAPEQSLVAAEPSESLLAEVMAALAARDLTGGVFLKAGRRCVDLQFGRVGPIVMLQSSARGAIEMLWACHAAIGGEPWRLQVEGTEAHFGYAQSRCSSETLPLTQLTVSLAYHAALRFWGPRATSQLRVEFELIPTLDTRPAYERLFGNRVGFGMLYTGLRFPAALLDIERVGADHTLAARMRELALTYSLQSSRATSWWWRVESTLQTTPLPVDRGLDQVASALRVSTRTLRRRLSEEGTTFSEVAARVRQQRATRLLIETDLPLHQIAQMVGYADSNSFRRRFRKSLGCSPLEIRRRGRSR